MSQHINVYACVPHLHNKVKRDKDKQKLQSMVSIDNLFDLECALSVRVPLLCLEGK